MTDFELFSLILFIFLSSIIILFIVCRIMLFCFQFSFYRNASKYFEKLNNSFDNNK